MIHNLADNMEASNKDALRLWMDTKSEEVQI